MFLPTRILLSGHLVRATATLFTRPNCGLCDMAKDTLTQLHKRRPFTFRELDVMLPGNETWKNAYEFDVPVLHVREDESGEPKKLFHRFTEKEVERVIDSVEDNKLL